jgi:hypothetical protein
VVGSGATLSGTGIITAATLAHSGAGTVNLTGLNRICTLGTSGALGAFTLNNAQSINLGTINAGANAIAVTTANGANITLNSGAVLTSNASGTAITLGAGGNVINNAGSAALSAASGRWLVYSAAPASDTFGNLDSGNAAVWNTANGASVGATGDRYVFAYQPTLTVTSNLWR